MSSANPEAVAWSVGSLRLLRTMNLAGATLEDMAERMGVSRRDCDRALWALLGRTPEAACAKLNPARAA